MTEIDIAGVERIGIPKGDDRQPCVAAFEEVTGIEVPDFKDRKLSAISQGLEFFLLKGKDIPGFAGAGLIDMGATGTDSVDGYNGEQLIQSQKIGEAMCRLLLMSEENKREQLEIRLQATRWVNTMPVATPLPEAVNSFAACRDLPLQAVELPAGVTISGSMEIMPRLLAGMGVELIADRVDSGQTAQDNGLVELMPIMNIYPALVQKATV